MRFLRVRSLALAVVLASVGMSAGAAGASPPPKVTTVVAGLDNPRDLAFGPDGRLYVAEAGHGGSLCVPGGPNGTTCVGTTSGIRRLNIRTGASHRIVSGLASESAPKGVGATGIDGISIRRNGKIFGITALAPDAVPPGLVSPEAAAEAQRQFGQLITVTRAGAVRFIADVGHVDYLWSAAHAELVPGQFPEANPYGVLALPRAVWVVDAASNTIDRIGSDGKARVVAFVPNPPVSDAVPTCIDRGPDGALYIGELTGNGNRPGASVVWRFAPRAHRLTKWATGLTAVTGCGFAPNGRFYATEFSTLGVDNPRPGTGAVVRVRPHSTSPTPVVAKLDFPGGFAAGRDGSLYVSNWSTSPATGDAMPSGRVVRIVLGSKRRRSP